MTVFRPSSSRGTKPRTACTLIEPPFDKLRTARRRGAGGYTLVELLVVIAIIMILVTLLAPSLRRAREMMRRVACKNNQRALLQAAHHYNEYFRCFSPMGFRENTYPSDGGPASVLWYQKEFLGQFFGEDVPKGPEVDGVSAPPLKSLLRCPSESLYINPLRSWIAYNSFMSYAFEPAGSNQRCYVRGPKIEEIFTPADRFLMFTDGRGSGVYYFAQMAYQWPPHDMSHSGGTTDHRHEGGVNVTFLDGHATYFPEPWPAYNQKLVYMGHNNGNR